MDGFFLIMMMKDCCYLDDSEDKDDWQKNNGNLKPWQSGWREVHSRDRQSANPITRRNYDCDAHKKWIREPSMIGRHLITLTSHILRMLDGETM